MKNLIIASLTILLSLTSNPHICNAGSAKKSEKLIVVKTTGAEDAMANALLTRINQINSMNKSNLTFKQKHELSREVKSIQNQLRYVHFGSLLVIITLLIISLKFITV